MTLKNSSVIQKLELKNPSNLLALSFLSTKKDLQIVLEKFNPRKSLRICSRRMEDARSLDSPWVRVPINCQCKLRKKRKAEEKEGSQEFQQDSSSAQAKTI